MIYEIIQNYIREMSGNNKYAYTPKIHLESVVKKLHPTISSGQLHLISHIFSSNENRFKTNRGNFLRFSNIADILYKETELDGELV